MFNGSFNQLVNKGPASEYHHKRFGWSYMPMNLLSGRYNIFMTRLEIVDSNVQNLLRDQSKQNGITFHVDDKSTRVRSTVPLYSR